MSQQTAIVKPVSEIFNPRNPMYIPDIQRDYAWEKDEIEALWKDIKALHDNSSPGEPLHFMGVIVMYEEQSKLWVLDGQQRLTTIYMMLDLLSKKIKEISDKKITAEQKETLDGQLSNNNMAIGMLKGYDPSGLKPQRSIILNQRNNQFFDNMLANRKNDCTPEQIAVNKKLNVAYDYISKLIDETLSENDFDDDDYVDQILSLYAYEAIILNRMEFISFVASSETSANQIFECLNARGKELDASDLIKNYFAGKATKEEAEDWMNYMKSKMGLDSPALSRFIRYYCNSRWSFVRQAELYSKVKETIDGGEISIKKMIVEQEKLVGVYSAFTTDNSSAYSDPETKILIEYAKYLGVTTFIPVMIAMRYQRERNNMFSEKDEKHVLAAIITFIFRNVILVGSGAGANKVEKEMARMACDISHGGLVTSKDIIDRIIKNDNRSDSEIINDFRKFSSTSGNTLRYILLNLELLLSLFSWFFSLSISFNNFSIISSFSFMLFSKLVIVVFNSSFSCLNSFFKSCFNFFISFL